MIFTAIIEIPGMVVYWKENSSLTFQEPRNVGELQREGIRKILTPALYTVVNSNQMKGF